jgi:hypothetical protein
MIKATTGKPVTVFAASAYDGVTVHGCRFHKKKE